MVSDKDTIWHTGLRLIYQLQSLSSWVPHHELRGRLHAYAKESKEDKIDLHRLKAICPKIPSAQVDLLFEDCQNRIKTTVERGRKNMLSEALASILLGTEDLRRGVRMMKDWRHGTSYFVESPLDGFEDTSGEQSSRELAMEKLGSNRTPEETQAFLVDNSELKATPKGVGYRRSKDILDKEPGRTALWGTVIYGVASDGWVSVDDIFLPRQVRGATVLKLLEPQEARDIVRSQELARKQEALALRNFERSNGMPEGTATVDQVMSTSAGIAGWARGEGESRRQLGAPQAESDPDHPATPRTSSAGTSRQDPRATPTEEPFWVTSGLRRHLRASALRMDNMYIDISQLQATVKKLESEGGAGPLPLLTAFTLPEPEEPPGG